LSSKGEFVATFHFSNVGVPFLGKWSFRGTSGSIMLGQEANLGVPWCRD
jgi:hypothetical protein